MANVVNRIFTDRMGGRKASEYIGVKGDLFYDSETGDLRISDGVTPGGKPTNGANLGIYRGFQAGCNIFRNTNDQDIAQIFIHNAEGKVDYINYTADTNNDDFYVTGLQHDSAETDSSWNADRIVVLNVYSNSANSLAIGDLRTFVRKFIDTVLYTPEDDEVSDVQQAKDQFYANIETLTQSLPAGALYEKFMFDDNRRIHWPEYNGPNGNATANIKVFIQPSWEYPDGDYENDSFCELLMLSSGTGYSIGDKIVMTGQQLGGVNGTNDLTIEVTGLKSGNITGLTMTSGGTGFWPNTGDLSNASGLNGGGGENAYVRINTCTAAGEIVDWNIQNDGYDYQVGDTLTLNFGGDDAEFEVTSVGTNGINSWNQSGTGYIDSPARIPNGYWPNMHIADGNADQYDDGNWISTSESSNGLNVSFDGRKMTINGNYTNSTIPLQPGMYCTLRNPNDNNDFSNFTLIAQATDDSNVWYVSNSYGDQNVQVRIDGIPYGQGVPQNSAAFGGGQYVTVYDQSIFAMIAINADTNRVYYNGEMGADSGGVKDIEVLFGVDGGAQDSIGVPQRLLGNIEYTIVPSDAGKHLYYPNGNNTIYIPVETTANFPVGTAITFVSSNDNPTWISRNEGDVTQVWGAGFNTQSNWWAIPANSMGTILKIGPEKWIVSGAGLYNDD